MYVRAENALGFFCGRARDWLQLKRAWGWCPSHLLAAGWSKVEWPSLACLVDSLAWEQRDARSGETLIKRRVLCSTIECVLCARPCTWHFTSLSELRLCVFIKILEWTGTAWAACPHPHHNRTWGKEAEGGG